MYQAVRARLAGEIPANRDLTNRVLRALAASVVLDSVYGILLGPTLVKLVGGDTTSNAHLRHWFLNHARLGSLLALLLLFLFPAAVAYFAARRYFIGEWISHARERGPLSLNWGPHRARLRRIMNAGLGRLGASSEVHGGLRFDPTPTAWDWAVDHGGSGEGFVRIFTSGSEWHGGLYRRDSYFSSYPDLPAIFVEEAWQLDERGTFIAPQPGSRGAWIPCTKAIAVEFLNAEPAPSDGSAR